MGFDFRKFSLPNILSCLKQNIMPKYYCEYCDAPLTHDSPAGRKQHNTGFKHKSNVRAYYANFVRVREEELAQLGLPSQMPAGFAVPVLAKPGIPETMVSGRL